jgi:predicted DNA-binding protein
MASNKSKAKSVRLANETWDKIEWVAADEGKKVNDLIKEAIEAMLATRSIPDLSVTEGQQQLFTSEV